MKCSQPFPASCIEVDFTSILQMPPHALWKKCWWESNPALILVKSVRNTIHIRGSQLQTVLNKVFPARSALNFFDNSFLFGWRKRITFTGVKINGVCKQKTRICPGNPGCLEGLTLLPVRTTGGFWLEMSQWVEMWCVGAYSQMCACVNRCVGNIFYYSVSVRPSGGFWEGACWACTCMHGIRMSYMHALHLLHAVEGMLGANRPGEDPWES